MELPAAAKERLLHILRILESQAESNASKIITSAELEQLTGWPRDTIRKDFSYLTGAGGEGGPGTSAGYSPEKLVPLIRRALGLDRKRKFCVVGLGRLGSAFLNLAWEPDFELAAGFDSNVNRVEILASQAPLFPMYKMPEVISRLGIEMAFLCVPPAAAQAAAEKLYAAGIRGIVNFAPQALALPLDMAVQNVYVIDHLRSLAIKMRRTV
jgi:redox-sensing transcriptional repressor